MPIRRLASLAFALLVLAVPSPLRADCDPAGPIERVLPKADVAFVGTVMAAEGPVAQLAVAEVWAGNIPNVVEVRGLMDRLAGRGGDQPVGEDDRLWAVGQTYLVVPTVDGDALRDHICTATTEWSPEMDVLRPENARIVAGDEATGPMPPALILAGAIVLLLVGGASVLAYRHR